MGCHTWFYRPLTDEEFKLVREYCIQDAEELLGDTPENRKADAVNLGYLNEVYKSFEEDIPCIFGKYYWWQMGFGFRNPKLLDKGILVVIIRNKLYVEIMDMHETARVSTGIYTYPKKIIHNKKELRRYVRKRYFNLTEKDHEMLSRFWRDYPDGIMMWG